MVSCNRISEGLWSINIYNLKLQSKIKKRVLMENLFVVVQCGFCLLVYFCMALV